MMHTTKFFRNIFRFTSERPLDPVLFERPLHRSLEFRANTLMMLLCLAVETIILVRYWAPFPALIKFLLVLVGCFLFGCWIRAVADHTNLRRIRSRGIREDAVVAATRLAAGSIIMGTSNVFTAVLLLLVTMLLALHHKIGRAHV